MSSVAPTWDPVHLPSQADKTFVVTGGNAGIGYFISEQLARAGAHVVIASRNAEKAAAAQRAIVGQVPRASVSFIRFDLSSLAGVAESAAKISALDRIDGIIENAAVMSMPTRGSTTQDGFELMVGATYLGNFALSALVLPALARTAGSRLVTTGSELVDRADTDLSNLTAPLSRGPKFLAAGKAYQKAKTAVEVFTYELDRRLREAHLDVAAIVSRPGMAHDSKSPERPGVLAHKRGQRFREPLWALIGQSKESAAWPAVRAAIDAGAESGQLWTPLTSVKGVPTRSEPSPPLLDPERGRRLWEDSERLTGITFDVADVVRRTRPAARRDDEASFGRLHLHSLHHQPQRQRQFAQQAGQQDPWDERV